VNSNSRSCKTLTPCNFWTIALERASGSAAITVVITGLDPVIHALLLPVVAVKDVDGRVKPGHDEI
jgi:hypothetical protein